MAIRKITKKVRVVEPDLTNPVYTHEWSVEDNTNYASVSDFYLTYDNIDYYFTKPNSIEISDKFYFNTNTKVLKLNETTISTSTTGSSENRLLFVPAHKWSDEYIDIGAKAENVFCSDGQTIEEKVNSIVGIPYAPVAQGWPSAVQLGTGLEAGIYRIPAGVNEILVGSKSIPAQENGILFLEKKQDEEGVLADYFYYFDTPDFDITDWSTWNALENNLYIGWCKDTSYYGGSFVSIALGSINKKANIKNPVKEVDTNELGFNIWRAFNATPGVYHLTNSNDERINIYYCYDTTRYLQIDSNEAYVLVFGGEDNDIYYQVYSKNKSIYEGRSHKIVSGGSTGTLRKIAPQANTAEIDSNTVIYFSTDKNKFSKIRLDDDWEEILSVSNLQDGYYFKVSSTNSYNNIFFYGTNSYLYDIESWTPYDPQLSGWMFYVSGNEIHNWPATDKYYNGTQILNETNWDFEITNNKVTSILSTSTDIQYPSAKAVYSALPKNTSDITNDGDGIQNNFVNYYSKINYQNSGFYFDANDKISPVILGQKGNYDMEITKNKVISISSSATDTQYPSAKAVYNAIASLPEPMIFKGSLGTGGTITTLPAASDENEGFTYKVITNGTYASQTAKAGDTFISDGTQWVLIPSGDEPNGTVTSITLKATSPIAIDSSSAITTSGTRTLSHANSGVTASTYRSVTVNATGHVTAGTNPTTLSGYGITDAVAKAGDTMTGTLKLSSGDLKVITGTIHGEDNGTASYTNHAIKLGHAQEDYCNFYEYGGLFNFYKSVNGNNTLLGTITSNGWEGGAKLTGTPTAPTAAASTNSTQIATTAFVKSVIPDINATTSDPGVGSTLASGDILLVYEP